MKNSAKNVDININTSTFAKKTLYYFISIEIIFLLLDIIINFNRYIDYGPIRRLFNIAREDSFPSWFMTSQTLLVALTLWFILFLYSHNENINKFTKIGWLILASFFTYLAADDGSMIHERVGSTFKLIATEQDNINSISNTIFSIFPSYSWQIILLPIFAAMGIFILLFLWKIFGKSTKMLFVILAFSFLSVAVVLDFIEGLDKDSVFNIYYVLINNYNIEVYTVKHFAKAIEELFEMFGMTLFLYVFIKHTNQVSTRAIKLI